MNKMPFISTCYAINIVFENINIIWKSWILKKKKKAMDIVHSIYSYYGIVIAMALKNIMTLGMDLKRSQM